MQCVCAIYCAKAVTNNTDLYICLNEYGKFVLLRWMRLAGLGKLFRVALLRSISNNNDIIICILLSKRGSNSEKLFKNGKIIQYTRTPVYWSHIEELAAQVADSGFRK